jgi:hypothetical protein
MGALGAKELVEHMAVAYKVEHVLVTLVVLIAGYVLLYDRFVPTIEPSRWHGSIIEGVGAGGTLRRGSSINSGSGYLLADFEGVRFALAERTELVFTGMDGDLAKVTLLGGRITTSGPTNILTPWISATSLGPMSVVNYSFDDRVQILPMSPDVMVAVDTLGTLPLTRPAEWIERDRDLVLSLLPFDPTASAEAAYYAWALPLIQSE